MTLRYEPDAEQISSAEQVSKALKSGKESLQKLPKSVVINRMIQRLETAEPRDVVSGFIKTLKNSGVETKNAQQVSQFMNQHFNREFIQFIQRSLVQAGIKMEYTTSRGKVVSGIAACDGSWGRSSQSALNAFQSRNEAKAHKEIMKNRAEQYEKNVQEHYSKLQTLSGSLQLPTKIRSNTKKLNKVLMILAQGNSDLENGLTETHFPVDSSAGTKITKAILTLSQLIHSNKQYRAKYVRHGVIEVNGTLVDLWNSSANQEITGKPKIQLVKIPPAQLKRVREIEKQMVKNSLKEVSNTLENLMQNTQLSKEAKAKLSKEIKNIKLQLSQWKVAGGSIHMSLNKVFLKRINKSVENSKKILRSNSAPMSSIASLDEIKDTMKVALDSTLRSNDSWRVDNYKVPKSRYDEIMQRMKKKFSSSREE